MWQHGYQVIVSYEEVVEVEKHCELWPAIPYWWGNRTSTHALIQYLERMKRMGRPGTYGSCCKETRGRYGSAKQRVGWEFTGWGMSPRWACCMLQTLAQCRVLSPTREGVQHACHLTCWCKFLHKCTYVHRLCHCSSCFTWVTVEKNQGMMRGRTAWEAYSQSKEKCFCRCTVCSHVSRGKCSQLAAALVETHLAEGDWWVENIEPATNTWDGFSWTGMVQGMSWVLVNCLVWHTAATKEDSPPKHF